MFIFGEPCRRNLWMSKTALLRGVIIAMGLLTARAEAAILDTGLGSYGSKDLNWEVRQSAGGDPNTGLLNKPYAYIADPSTSSFPFNLYWAQPLAGSNWIVPTPGGPTVSLDPDKNGFYNYTQYFSVNPGQSISGAFLADNLVTKITLFDIDNPGTTIIYNGPGEGNFKLPTTFSSGPLTADNYVISFVVENIGQNGGNPSGLDVAFSSVSGGLAGPVPEPSTWAAMILGFLCLGFLGYRRTGSFRFS
jgi:hypothetical protein